MMLSKSAIINVVKSQVVIFKMKDLPEKKKGIEVNYCRKKYCDCKKAYLKKIAEFLLQTGTI